MKSNYTAIIHLRDASRPPGRSMLESLLRVISGVEEVSFEPRDRFITVSFDDEVTSLAELVRAVEDAGSPVSGVAQRPVRV